MPMSPKEGCCASLSSMMPMGVVSHVQSDPVFLLVYNGSYRCSIRMARNIRQRFLEYPEQGCREHRLCD